MANIEWTPLVILDYDEFANNNGQFFSTLDRDNVSGDDATRQVAQRHSGAWWYNKDWSDVNPNGLYGSRSAPTNVHWEGAMGEGHDSRSLKFTELKIKRV